MVDPRIMCRQHILGEHLELHMLAGHLAHERRIGGYVEINAVEPKSIGIRHDVLVAEFRRRGYAHNVPLTIPSLDYLLEEHKNAKVDQVLALRELLRRCYKCRRDKK